MPVFPAKKINRHNKINTKPCFRSWLKNRLNETRKQYREKQLTKQENNHEQT